MSHVKVSFRNLGKKCFIQCFSKQYFRISTVCDILEISFILRQNKESCSEYFSCRISWVLTTFVLCVVPGPSQISIWDWLACSLSPFTYVLFNSVKANRFALCSSRFVQVLFEEIGSHLLGFHFHKCGSLLTVSPNFAVLWDFFLPDPFFPTFQNLWSEAWDRTSIFAALCDQTHVKIVFSSLQCTCKVSLLCSPH